ncbi:hypothetical protein [Streptomyces sp. NPDC046727]|uniref:hypothetical protein n=1 Tax=Streptomyces sp. NPDC046727 TaxID=3155373 RepID=UPI00340D8ED9
MDNVGHTGFTPALAFSGADVIGFPTAWTTLAPFRTDRCYPQAAAGLGPQRTEQGLYAARKIDELAVRPADHGTGPAARLPKSVTGDAHDGETGPAETARSRQWESAVITAS